MENLDRITQRLEVMGGKPCIRGMRVTVGMIVGQIGAGHSVNEILADYPYLEREDIMQALRCGVPDCQKVFAKGGIVGEVEQRGSAGRKNRP